MSEAAPASLRIDKWLFFARFIKHRQLAAELLRKRRIRINNQLIKKPHHALRVGDIATLVRPNGVIVLRVTDLGTRRGPPAEAQTLYEIVEQA